MVRYSALYRKCKNIQSLYFQRIAPVVCYCSSFVHCIVGRRCTLTVNLNIKGFSTHVLLTYACHFFSMDTLHSQDVLTFNLQHETGTPLQIPLNKRLRLSCVPLFCTCSILAYTSTFISNALLPWWYNRQICGERKKKLNEEGCFWSSVFPPLLFLKASDMMSLYVMRHCSAWLLHSVWVILRCQQVKSDMGATT